MRYGLIDSGLGLLGCAAALLDRDPDAELVIAMDPDAMPYGALTADELAARVRELGRALAGYRPDAVVVACNTASVHALEVLRADHEPALPIVGTVPAVKRAAAAGRPFAIWATARTTGSTYQRDLIERFAPGVEVTEVACPGFAEAVETGDAQAVAAAIEAAVLATPSDITDVVLGCTHFPLVEGEIRAGFGRPVVLHDSAGAVADQAVRRAADAVRRSGASGGHTGRRLVAVIESGRPSRLPARALGYPAGRRVAAVAADGAAPYSTGDLSTHAG